MGRAHFYAFSASDLMFLLTGAGRPLQAHFEDCSRTLEGRKKRAAIFSKSQISQM